MKHCDFNTIIVNIVPIFVLTILFWISFHWVNLKSHFFKFLFLLISVGFLFILNLKFPLLFYLNSINSWYLYILPKFLIILYLCVFVLISEKFLYFLRLIILIKIKPKIFLYNTTLFRLYFWIFIAVVIFIYLFILNANFADCWYVSEAVKRQMLLEIFQDENSRSALIDFYLKKQPSYLIYSDTKFLETTFKNWNLPCIEALKCDICCNRKLFTLRDLGLRWDLLFMLDTTVNNLTYTDSTYLRVLGITSANFLKSNNLNPTYLAELTDLPEVFLNRLLQVPEVAVPDSLNSVFNSQNLDHFLTKNFLSITTTNFHDIDSFTPRPGELITPYKHCCDCQDFKNVINRPVAYYLDPHSKSASTLYKYAPGQHLLSSEDINDPYVYKLFSVQQNQIAIMRKTRPDEYFILRDAIYGVKNEYSGKVASLSNLEKNFYFKIFKNEEYFIFGKKSAYKEFNKN